MVLVERNTNITPMQCFILGGKILFPQTLARLAFPRFAPSGY